MGGEIGTYLTDNQWEVAVDYRYLHANEMFQEGKYQPQFQKGGTNADITVHSWDLAVTYAPIQRLDLTLDLPFVYGSADIVSNRFHQTASGLGDLRFIADLWIFKPSDHPNGNISAGLGLKAPTGDSNVKEDTVLSPVTGVHAVRPVDSALQPGDGAFAIISEVSAFQKVFKNAYLYLAGSYQFSTVGEGDTETTIPSKPAVHYSVPDTFLGRGGMTYFIYMAVTRALAEPWGACRGSPGAQRHHWIGSWLSPARLCRVHRPQYQLGFWEELDQYQRPDRCLSRTGTQHPG